MVILAWTRKKVCGNDESGGKLLLGLLHEIERLKNNSVATGAKMSVVLIILALFGIRS